MGLPGLGTELYGRRVDSLMTKLGLDREVLCYYTIRPRVIAWVGLQCPLGFQFQTTGLAWIKGERRSTLGLPRSQRSREIQPFHHHSCHSTRWHCTSLAKWGFSYVPHNSHPLPYAKESFLTSVTGSWARCRGPIPRVLFLVRWAPENPFQGRSKTKFRLPTFATLR